MALKESLKTALTEALKARDSLRSSTLRLINAAIQDREISLRADGNWTAELSDSDITALLSKMVKQRQDSARLYEEGGRLELAAKEMGEISIINEFLPRQLDSGEVALAVDQVIAELKAGSLREMGAVMAALKSQYAGRMDFAAAGALVRAKLS